MKTFLIASLLCVASSGFCQTPSVIQDASSVTNTNVFVTVRGPASRVWAMTTTHTNKAGKVIVQTNNVFTEISDGLCYLDENGQWQDSVAQIDVTPDGAAATHSAHKVHWMQNANAPGGALTLTTPDNRQFVSLVHGLCYVDTATGSNALIAELQDSQGQLVGNNKIVYPNAFAGVKADIEYIYTVAGLEQNIILREQPPAPEAYGMSSKSTRLEVLTEFMNPPAPRIVQAVAEGASYDDFLDFGVMSIGEGGAFLIPGQGDPQSAGQVFKHWMFLDGHHYLFEELPYLSISNQLLTLPQHAGLVRPGKDIKNLALVEPKTPQSSGTKPVAMQVLPVMPHKPGLVIDYNIVSSAANYTFQCDTTYYVSGNVTMSGTNTTFEGGTVIKYASGTTMTVNSRVTWLGAMYLPVIMTAKDDNSVGGSISGSTGNPGTTRYATIALNYNDNNAGTNLIASHLRVLNAATAVAINNGSSSDVLSHVQMVNCDNGVAASSANFSLLNALMYKLDSGTFMPLFPA